MTEIAMPGVCQACGRSLPEKAGRGRQRRYCDASCRSAAWRRRERGDRIVNQRLTADHRHEYLDNTNSESGSGDLAAASVINAAHRLVDELGQPSTPQGAVAAARELSVVAEAAMQTAVDRARAAGQSWRDIGAALGTTRQAAFQRFGRPIDPRTGTPMSRDIPADATERAVAIFAWHDQGRWQKILDELDDAMRARHDQALLSRGWASLAGMFGRLDRIGEPFARRAADDIIVEVPLHFEAGDARGIVRFSSDGRIAGMGIRPASPSTGKETA
jgi:hypothetical protein